MADTATLQAQLDELRKARASGARSVEYDSGFDRRRVEFKSDAELAAAIADLERRLSNSKMHTVRLWTSKGV